MTVDEIKQFRADQQFKAIKGFYIHFLVYAGVSLLLVMINVLDAGPMWAQWPVIGWGIGILFHAYSAFVVKPRKMAKWEADQLERIAQRAGAATAG